ncbi:Glutaredoxin [Hypsizygus marmoreus]|uniref:Glutaredoxin n=1 Tax=Hypsizygus marmoreus TaxID=39966 RepID=A0A369JWP8_HYPMA|nr:Glutaredoxin [Hypsizygus marmoreus]
MSSPAPPSRTPIRRRRFLLVTAVLVGLLFVFGVPWELPPSLRDASFSTLSRANFAQLAKSKPTPLPVPKVEEIFGLLHVVTGDAEEARFLSEAVDSDAAAQPINMTTYAGGDAKIDWRKTVARLTKKYPIVVFSKSYCPYSRRAKQLLETYNIHPAPKVIEVDLREDSEIIKTILTRLTQHSTFPNIVIRGKSIGGSDDLQALHAQRLLTKVLEQAGAVVRGDGSRE